MAKQTKKTPAAKKAAPAKNPAPAAPKEVWKSIVSTDPRKPFFMAELKTASRCGKVTMVEIGKDGTRIRGNCMNPKANNAMQGFVTVSTPSDAPVGAMVDGHWRPAEAPTKAAANAEKAVAAVEAKLASKVVIQDACAAAGCTEAPIAKTSYCGTHTVEAMKAIIDGRSAKPTLPLSKEAQTVCIEKGCRAIIRAGTSLRRCDKHAAPMLARMQRIANHVTKDINETLAKPATKKLLAEMVEPAPFASPFTPAMPTSSLPASFGEMEKAEQRKEAKRLTRALVAAGVTIQTQAEATGVTDGSVYRWYRASSAPTAAQFSKLVLLSTAQAGQAFVPRKPAKEKAITGSIKTPTAAAAKQVTGPKPADQRQLMLNLRDALNAVLGATA